MTDILQNVKDEAAQFVASVSFQDLIDNYQDDEILHRVIKEIATRYADAVNAKMQADMDAVIDNLRKVEEKHEEMKKAIQKLRQAAKVTAAKIKAVEGLGLFDKGNLPNELNQALKFTKEYET